MQAPNWTPEQVAYLRDNWPRQSASAISKHVRKTRDAVIAKARRSRFAKARSSVATGRPDTREVEALNDFDLAVQRAHDLGLKVGPMAERPNGMWRAYVQKGTDIFRFAEGSTLAGALQEAISMAEADMKPVAPKGDFLA